MADDIVTRLRALGTERAIDFGPGVTWEPFPWAQQAADEIERLRALIDTWAKTHETWAYAHMGYGPNHSTTGKALSGLRNAEDALHKEARRG